MWIKAKRLHWMTSSCFLPLCSSSLLLFPHPDLLSSISTGGLLSLSSLFKKRRHRAAEGYNSVTGHTDLTSLLKSEKQEIALKQKQTKTMGDPVRWTVFPLSHVTSNFLNLIRPREYVTEPCPGLFSRKSTGSPLLGPCESHQGRGSPLMHH